MSSPVLAKPIFAAPFDALAATYDEVFTNSRIGRAQRNAVWQELDRVFHPGQRILEINCASGVDAVHLATRGVNMLACDVSSGMIRVARTRLSSAELRGRVDFRLLATEAIAALHDEGPFDGAFSNFGGLNCMGDLSSVACNLASLLRPGARAVLCLAGVFVPWEVVWYLAQGKLRKAFRRFHRGSVPVRLTDGVTVDCHYPSVRRVKRIFSPYFRLERWRGVGVSVPPTYYESLAGRFPRIFGLLVKADPWLGRVPLVRGWADHGLLTFERLEA